jgi:hypothetical protein
MDIDHLVELLRGLPFRQAVWLFPLATALHFSTPHFADWAASTRGVATRINGAADHGLGMVFALAFCGLVWCFRNRLWPSLLCPLLSLESVLNGLFHVALRHSLASIAQASSLFCLALPLWYVSRVSYERAC